MMLDDLGHVGTVTRAHSVRDTFVDPDVTPTSQYVQKTPIVFHQHWTSRVGFDHAEHTMAFPADGEMMKRVVGVSEPFRMSDSASQWRTRS